MAKGGPVQITENSGIKTQLQQQQQQQLFPNAIIYFIKGVLYTKITVGRCIPICSDEPDIESNT
jgi:hypothetical protein